LIVGVRPAPDAPCLDPTTVVVYYLTPDDDRGNHRGIMGLGGLAQVQRGGAGYVEVHPLRIARDMYMLGIKLPPELERYRKILDLDLSLPDAMAAWEESGSSSIPPPEEMRQATGDPGPTAPGRPDGEGSMSKRIPPAEELISIAEALRDFLATFAEYKLFLDDTSDVISCVLPTITVQDAFRRLEMVLNPQRLPYAAPELTGRVYGLCGWPRQVIVALPILRQHVDQLIQRWDIPEICDDRPMNRGAFTVTRDDGTIVEKVHRLVQPHTLTPTECERLAWVLNALLGALRETIEAPNPAALPKEENRPPTAPTLRTTTPPPSVVTTSRSFQARNDERKNMVRDQVFISYSHQDKKFLDELETHLRPSLRTGAVTAWSDRQIQPGSKWFDEIKTALAKTSVAVLLVTPKFLASDFIHKHELGPLLKEAADGGVKILWVLIRDCSYKETPLKDYQAVVSPPDKPFALMRAERDTAWTRVCEEIKKAVVEQATNHPFAGSSDPAGTAPVSQQETVPADSKTPPHYKPCNLPLASIGTLFKGRESFLDDLRQRLGARDGRAKAIVSRLAVHGLGGVGKTRAAVEYAWRHADDCAPRRWGRMTSGVSGTTMLRER
jgi:hypothetical protein